MYDAYARIFTRMGLKFRAVDADMGAIGGLSSHEFQVLADSGEDAIAYSDGLRLRGQRREGGGARAGRIARAAAAEAMAKVPTPGMSTCEEVAQLLKLPLARTVKCLMVWAGERVHMLLVRGDHMGNEVKIGKLPGMDGWRWATDAEIVAATGCKPGYLGPVGIPRDLPLIVDRAVAVMADFVCGANEPDFHLRGVNFGRDCREPDLVADIRNVVKGDPSPDGKGTLDIVRGIEVGHVFALGQRSIPRPWAQLISTPAVNPRSSRWAATGSASPASWPRRSSRTTTSGGSSGRSRWRPSRWPSRPSGYDRNEAVRGARPTGCTTSWTAAGVEVLLDDRGERPGVMFADLELIGIPHRITIGDRGLKEGNVEYQGRRDAGGHRRCPWRRSPTFVRGKLARS